MTYTFFLNVLWFFYVKTSAVFLSPIHHSMYSINTSSFTKTSPKALVKSSLGTPFCHLKYYVNLVYTLSPLLSSHLKYLQQFHLSGSHFHWPLQLRSSRSLSYTQSCLFKFNLHALTLLHIPQLFPGLKIKNKVLKLICKDPTRYDPLTSPLSSRHACSLTHWLCFSFRHVPLSLSLWRFCTCQILPWVGLFYCTHMITYLLLLLWIAVEVWFVLDTFSVLQTRLFSLVKLSNRIMFPVPFCPPLLESCSPHHFTISHATYD